MDFWTLLLIIANITAFIGIAFLVFFRFIKPMIKTKFYKDIFHLEKHIQGLQEKGWKDGVILKKMTEAGWDSKIVELVIHEVHKPDNKIDNLHRYIVKQLKKGRSKKQIRDILLKANWKADLVDLALGIRK